MSLPTGCRWSSFSQESLLDQRFLEYDTGRFASSPLAVQLYRLTFQVMCLSVITHLVPLQPSFFSNLATICPRDSLSSVDRRKVPTTWLSLCPCMAIIIRTYNAILALLVLLVLKGGEHLKVLQVDSSEYFIPHQKGTVQGRVVLFEPIMKPLECGGCWSRVWIFHWGRNTVHRDFPRLL